MIAPWLADVLRWLDMAGSLVLVVAAAYAIRYAEHADQRVRFGLFAVFGVLLTSGHVTGLGHGSDWRLPVLMVAVSLAVWSTIKYVVRARAGHRE